MDKTKGWLNMAEEDLLWAKASFEDKTFQQLDEVCNLLSPYYLSTRYPDVAQFEEFSEKQTQDVITQAEKVVNFVKSKLQNP